ncbi:MULTISPECIES: vitamin K epoxide reductase family protein [unclassified Streptomyces]|uniref:vitamin K epoxide reductase family protein n=1 Tax=unclassified Streptomyces TaxID=2593676 RepID=UPI0022579A03|nr:MULTISPECIES: vitamin K epoxide reductase family protein [unclassified Streptomyces]MCX5436061.1 vitamin K epoxide reductase family protein [Streptomyces sp. NBC_00063]WSE13854.1 vitamin K epoxide reductase family protein [Streptomyces sp. NBC_01397]
MSKTTTASDSASSSTGDDGAGSARSAGGSLGFALLLVITGAAGLLAAWVITIDKFKLLEDPNFTPGCSLNPVVSCGNIMKSDQASVFGFPNPMLGLAAYAVVICVGMSLLGRARFPRWYWLTFNAGTLFGVGFCTWLQFQSLYRINSLCLWCSLAWVATIVMFWYVTSFNVRNGFLPAPSWLRSFFGEFTWVLPVLHVGIIGMLILTRWWDFWTS